MDQADAMLIKRLMTALNAQLKLAAQRRGCVFFTSRVIKISLSSPRFEFLEAAAAEN